MLLLTEPKAPPEFWSFPGRPVRRTAEPVRNDAFDWHSHPLAPAIEALLTERQLDEWDIDLFVDERTLYAITACWPHDFRAALDGTDGRAIVAALIPDLDHLVAWRRRDAMIAAAFEAADDACPWITPPSRTTCGGIGAKPEGAFGDAVPLWAVVASTALLDHLQRIGMTPIDALRHACAQPSDPDSTASWAALGDVRIHYEAGRLHARELARQYIVDDWYGLTLNLPAKDLPETVMAAALKRRLSAIAGFSSPPALLLGIDPAITRVQRVKSYWTNAMATGLLVTLELGTETLADIPRSALAAVGDPRSEVPRSEKPWLDDGSESSPGVTLCQTDVCHID